MVRIRTSNDSSGRIVVSFLYDPLLIARIKAIDMHSRHSAEKHGSFSNTQEMLGCHCEKRNDEAISNESSNLEVDCPRLTDGAKRSRGTGSIPGVCIWIPVI